MKLLLFIFLLFTTFQSSAAYIIDAGSTCVTNNNAGSHLVGSMYLYEQEAIAAIESVNWSDTQCYGSAYKATYGTSDSRYISFDSGKKISYYIRRVHSGCDFDTCKQIAEDECLAKGQTFNPDSYVFRGNTDYDSECNPPPPEQPIQNAEECQTLSNNQCNNRGSSTDSIFTDNGDFTFSCNYTCGDGTTGNENGSLANNNDGFCDINDPNDLADCDVVDNTDPDCIIGCGDAFTPTPTNDLDYNSDGTTLADGTGTDGITTTQGDVLINEVIKSSNINAEETIKSSNQITKALDSIDPNEKLSELITAVRENKPLSSGGSGTDFNDTNIVNSINSLGIVVRDSSDNIVNAIQDNSIDNIVAISGNYDSTNFYNLLSSTAGLESKIIERETILKSNIAGYKSDLTSQLSFLTPSSSGYTTNNLQLSQGSFDVSWSRFSQYFSTIGTIVYALSALIALSILFMGRI
jgi:hypothetical protein